MRGFGPPPGLTRASPWPWLAHLASGRVHATKFRAIHPRFHYGFFAKQINLATCSTLADSFFNRNAVTQDEP